MKSKPAKFRNEDKLPITQSAWLEGGTSNRPALFALLQSWKASKSIVHEERTRVGKAGKLVTLTVDVTYWRIPFAGMTLTDVNLAIRAACVEDYNLKDKRETEFAQYVREARWDKRPSNFGNAIGSGAEKKRPTLESKYREAEKAFPPGFANVIFAVFGTADVSLATLLRALDNFNVAKERKSLRDAGVVAWEKVFIGPMADWKLALGDYIAWQRDIATSKGTQIEREAWKAREGAYAAVMDTIRREATVKEKKDFFKSGKPDYVTVKPIVRGDSVSMVQETIPFRKAVSPFAPVPIIDRNPPTVVGTYEETKLPS